MDISEILKKRWKMLIAILGIIIIVFIGYSFWAHQVSVGWGSDSTLLLYELNGSVVPRGNIISLTEEDFKEFPKLAPVIQDKTQKALEIMDDGSRLYKIYLTMDDRGKFNSHYGSGGFFEYKEKYYGYDVLLH